MDHFRCLNRKLDVCCHRVTQLYIKPGLSEQSGGMVTTLIDDRFIMFDLATPDVRPLRVELDLDLLDLNFWHFGAFLTAIVK